MNAAADTLVATRAASFGWDGKTVVGPLDLEVRRGDFVAVLGPNGAGKSTVARGLLGLLAPLSGACTRATGKLAFVPQREALDPVWPITVEEVVRTGAAGRLRGLRAFSRADRERARVLLAEVGLHAQRKAPFRSLSGGQRQRAMIARALLAEPELLVLDEPTSGVDRAALDSVRALLRALVAERGLTLVVVTHQTELVRGVANRAWWVEGGAVREFDAQALDELRGVEELGGEELGGARGRAAS